MNSIMKVILASASPRREKLLKRLVRSFSVKPARISERLLPGEPYSRACVRLAKKKASAIAKTEHDALVIGVDTIAHRGKRIFRKTDDAIEAREILRFLSGKTHTVATGVCVLFPNGKHVSYCERAHVKMRHISPKKLSWYIKNGGWAGRAGSYDVSGNGLSLVLGIRGEKETVIGLPIERLKRILRTAKSL
jgi:septum formation protein